MPFQYPPKEFYEAKNWYYDQFEGAYKYTGPLGYKRKYLKIRITQNPNGSCDVRVISQWYNMSEETMCEFNPNPCPTTLQPILSMIKRAGVKEPSLKLTRATKEHLFQYL